MNILDNQTSAKRAIQNVELYKACVDSVAFVELCLDLNFKNCALNRHSIGVWLKFRVMLFSLSVSRSISLLLIHQHLCAVRMHWNCSHVTFNRKRTSENLRVRIKESPCQQRLKKKKTRQMKQWTKKKKKTQNRNNCSWREQTQITNKWCFWQQSQPPHDVVKPLKIHDMRFVCGECIRTKYRSKKKEIASKVNRTQRVRRNWVRDSLTLRRGQCFRGRNFILFVTVIIIL